jgi:hypothetical protein
MKREKRKVVGSRNRFFFFFFPFILLGQFSWSVASRSITFDQGRGLRVRLGEKSHSSDCVLYEWLPCTSLPAALSLFLARKRYGEKKKNKKEEKELAFSLCLLHYSFSSSSRSRPT